MRMTVLRRAFFLSLCSSVCYTALNAGPSSQSFALSNSKLTCVVQVAEGILAGDHLEGKSAWLQSLGQPLGVSSNTDAGFGVEVTFTDWRAPGKQNNADNPVILGAADFHFVSSAESTDAHGGKTLTLFFRGNGHSIDLKVEYRLNKDVSTLRTRIAVRDTSFGKHFLRCLWPRRGTIEGVESVLKPGDFGQPVALTTQHGGVFFGVEFPAAENRFEAPSTLRCGQEIGERIQADWITSDWVAEGLAPDKDVKKWFFSYLDEIRVAPLRPYTLYNSWYDLRSPEYPRVPAENVMSERSAMKMVDLLRENMVRRHGISLDAFVLDDGWDTYDSDWVLRTEQWPNGLRPLAQKLAETHTSLGLWFGPTGGYSFRSRRIAWMKAHGYEVVGDQLCVAGKNYGALLKKRTTDFARNEGVAYYKWDGIQFSCSEPDHGHPIDIYSRRAVMQSVIAMCKSVREVNPSMFLNITSGTWLSPWWLKYANTIWMDGQDYGYADVPSISKRDAAITYRDFVLYEDFHLKDLWFPVSNLMTHGIIKGKLELLGSPEEPLDKFTDDVLLYVARGVSMYELYISPDIMSEGEWTSIAQSIAWAKDRFPTLMHTVMVGGNPLQREPYGYSHFDGSKGVIAVRNPVVEPQQLMIGLSTADGLARPAKDMVLERVYPTRWISPRLFHTGDSLRISLGAFETSVYELYPLAEAPGPLLAGAIFDEIPGAAGTMEFQAHSFQDDACILNPGKVTSLRVDSQEVPVSSGPIRIPVEHLPPIASVAQLNAVNGQIHCSIALAQKARAVTFAILLTPDAGVQGSIHPQVRVTVNGKETPAAEGNPEGRSRWFVAPLENAANEIVVHVSTSSGPWKGAASAYVIGMNSPSTHEIRMNVRVPGTERLLPPQPWPRGEIRETTKIGEVQLAVQH
ncbi:MAG: hypothetical protein WB699_07900 [Bacteroidota bacterium]